MPLPIIEPTTIIVASSKLKPRTNRGAAAFPLSLIVTYSTFNH
jgi:hypothetical protein